MEKKMGELHFLFNKYFIILIVKPFFRLVCSEKIGKKGGFLL